MFVFELHGPGAQQCYCAIHLAPADMLKSFPICSSEVRCCIAFWRARTPGGTRGKCQVCKGKTSWRPSGAPSRGANCPSSSSRRRKPNGPLTSRNRKRMRPKLKKQRSQTAGRLSLGSRSRCKDRFRHFALQLHTHKPLHVQQR